MRVRECPALFDLARRLFEIDELAKAKRHTRLRLLCSIFRSRSWALIRATRFAAMPLYLLA